MLRSVFIGAKDPFNDVLVHWLSQRTHFVGAIWTNLTSWRSTRGRKLGFVQQRLRRYGPVKVVNEALFYLYYHTFLKRGEVQQIRQRIIEPYWAQHGPSEWQWRGDAIYATSVNSPTTVDFLEGCQPDVAFATCVNEYFRKPLRSIARRGLFLWHEGITPEYKGLYVPFWAVHQGEFDKIGSTLLRTNQKIDDGEIFVQCQASGVDPFRDHHLYTGHKAIIDSLPYVEPFLVELERGTAEPIRLLDAIPRTYTYPGITDFVRQRLRLRRWSRGPTPLPQ
ncbi:MAG: hypothetical protein HY686_06835 [Chloroflexi bacterium]|nr:hypothetical protein [Chloroflexota bacterium]